MLFKNTFRIICALLIFSIFSACNNTDSTPVTKGNQKGTGVPTLVDVGADKCIPCVKMAPILEQLTEDFAGRMEVRFVDVWKFKEEAAKYGVKTIPTQIFYAPDGKELYRHLGFYGRSEILGKWRDLGYDFSD